jgi:hypothetical protein
MYCTGVVSAVSAVSQDLNVTVCGIVLDSLLKRSVTVYPLTQLYLLKDFSL